MSRAHSIVLTVSFAAAVALTLWVFYPGYMTNDAVFVHQFAQDGRYGDWQSPLMSILWRWIDPIAPGPGSMFLLIATVYWAGFAVLALALARRSAVLALLVPLVALAPPAFMLLGMIWRDVLFGTVWLLAAAIAFAVAERGAPARWAAQALALALVGFGVLLRPNAIFAAALLAAYVIWPARLDWKRTALLFVPAVAAGLALVQLTYYGLLDVKREHPLHSLIVFDLGGITHFSGENQFPVSWDEPQSAMLTSRCYDPRYWDAYWTLESCRFVMQRLERQDDKVFGTPRLLEAWPKAVIAHPLAYLRHRAAFAWNFLAASNLTLELYHAQDPGWTPLAQHRPFQALVALHLAIKQTPLFRLGIWLLAGLAIGALAWPRRTTAAGAFAVSVTASGVVYVLTFFVFGVASDFRYGYWLVLATLASALALVAAHRDRVSGPAASPAAV